MGAMLQVLTPGEEESRPDFGQEVFVHYTVRIDGDERILYNRWVRV